MGEEVAKNFIFGLKTSSPHNIIELGFQDLIRPKLMVFNGILTSDMAVKYQEKLEPRFFLIKMTEHCIFYYKMRKGGVFVTCMHMVGKKLHFVAQKEKKSVFLECCFE